VTIFKNMLKREMSTLEDKVKHLLWINRKCKS